MTAKKIKVILFTLIIVMAGLLLTSCAAADRYVDSGHVAMEDVIMAPEQAQERALVEEAPTADLDIKVLDERVGDSKLRHIIRTGSIELTVTDTQDKISEVRSIVEGAEGIISNSNVYEIRDGQYGAHLTLRVPNNNFDQVMEQLQALGKAKNVQTGTDDVTMQYIDLESRLKNQKVQEERLREILDMAETVEEVLEVERELNRVRGEIETMTAQLNHLKDQVSFSTINLTIREETIPTEKISSGPFENLGNRIGEAFVGSVNFILNAVSYMIIAFSALLPILIVLGIVVAIILLLVRSLIKRNKTVTENTEIEQE